MFTVILPIQIPYLLKLFCLSSKISFCPQQESWISRKMEMNECFLHVTQNICQITIPNPLLVQSLKTCFKCFSHASPILPSLLRIILYLYCQDKEPLQLPSIPSALPLFSVQVHRSCSASVPPPGPPVTPVVCSPFCCIFLRKGAWKQSSPSSCILGSVFCLYT